MRASQKGAQLTISPTVEDKLQRVAKVGVDKAGHDDENESVWKEMQPHPLSPPGRGQGEGAACSQSRVWPPHPSPLPEGRGRKLFPDSPALSRGRRNEDVAALTSSRAELTMPGPDPLRVEIAPEESVAALIYPAAATDRAGITLILGHGAGADQQSAFMVSFADALAARGLDVVTFNFLYTERRRRLPDSKDRLEACYRAVIETMRHHPPLAQNA